MVTTFGEQDVPVCCLTHRVQLQVGNFVVKNNLVAGKHSTGYLNLFRVSLGVVPCVAANYTPALAM